MSSKFTAATVLMMTTNILSPVVEGTEVTGGVEEFIVTGVAIVKK